MMTAARVARAHKCDLWHVHNAEGLGLGALLKLQTDLPLVYHAHKLVAQHAVEPGIAPDDFQIGVTDAD